MKQHNLPQGSDQWHAHRRVHFNASDAAAMLGCSPHKSRSTLIRELATGIIDPVDPMEQRLYDEGHRCEALARPLAEKIVGEDLYPVVGTEGKLSASFDGLTMAEDTAFEHKLLNDEIRAAFLAGPVGKPDLPLFYRVQMEQQCMVSGASRVLFMASKWEGDKLVEEAHCWYTPDPELAERIRGGWAQLEQDVAAYKPAEPDIVAVGATIDALPALVVSVEGRVVNSNLIAFRQAASAFLARIKTDLQTDQDFADAERTVAFCEDGEKRLELVKAQALAQTATIDELFRTIDGIREEMRSKRLQLDKLVKHRKESIRTEIVAQAQADLDAHVAALNARLGAAWIPRTPGRFAEAIKGKKTVATVREAASTALANAKIETSALADRLDANRKSLVHDERDWFFLFADFAHVGSAPPDTFKAIAEQRVRNHVEAEAEALVQRQRAEAIRAERVAAAAPAVPPAAAPAQVAPLVVPIGRGPRVPNPVPPLSTGQLNERLGFTVTSSFIIGLGITPAPSPTGARVGTWWNERDFPAICEALIVHLEQARDMRTIAA